VRREIKLVSNEDLFYTSIGRFIAEYSQLEFTLKSYVANAINLSDENFEIVMSHDFAMLCTIALKVLSRGKNENQIVKLKGIIKRCRKLNDARVRIVHGLWFVGRKGGSLVHSSRRQLETISLFDDAEDLLKLIDEAGSLCMDLWEWDH
jgi:hypothetical protein